MENQSFDPNNKFQFDNRVKNLLQIDNLYNLLARGTGMLLVALITMLFLANFVKAAASPPDIFLVPIVTLTPNGAAAYQPQTGDGLNFVPGHQQTAVNNDLDNVNYANTSTDNNVYSSSANYRAPQYNAFADGSANMKVNLPVEIIKKVDAVNFRISNNMPSSNDGSVGTTKTIFTFNADITSSSIKVNDLQYRWDFENDGQVDSYFSQASGIKHSYSTPGEYEVKLEVLDKAGNVYSAIRKVTVVANDTPSAYFQVNKISAPINTIIKFDSSLSSDNQYSRNNLKYRFDWDSDGQFDTNAENKTLWFHRFSEVGSFNVRMQVIDPEGATAISELTINIVDDTGPQAMMSVTKNGQFNYVFDASQSSDDHTPANLLKYRWDFNYGGENDIVFDTTWSSSPKYTGSYQIGGSKKIRLQVMDQQGFIGESFAEIDVPWTENYLNMAVSMMS